MPLPLAQLLTAACLLSILPGLVQIAAGQPATVASGEAAPAGRLATVPYWTQLTAAQRKTLAPLASDWENLDAQNRKKWVQIADHYPNMKPEEQQRAQQRMHEWIQLSAEQRRVARDSYLRAQTISPEKRAELLKRYQALPEDRKRQLATESKAGKKLFPHQPATEPVPTHAQVREGARNAGSGKSAPAAPATSAASAKPAGPLPAASAGAASQ